MSFDPELIEAQLGLTQDIPANLRELARFDDELYWGEKEKIRTAMKEALQALAQE